MARKPSGQVIETPRRRGGRVFALRFRAYGRRHYVTLGTSADGWTRERAERELAHTVADVERGIWRAREPAPEAPAPDPTFHVFASEWFASHRRQLRPTTVDDYLWQLEHHLLPYFQAQKLSEITVREVDRYRDAKMCEGQLSPASINKTLTRLAQVLEVALEYELIDRNPAKGRRRRLKAPRPRAIHLDSAGQIAALLDAARDLDAAVGARTSGRRALLSTLVFAGLRVGEACALRWRDVDLAVGRLRVAASKTDAGVREVELLPMLRDELAAHKARGAHTSTEDPVFTTAAGTLRDKDNVRAKVMAPAVKLANERLSEAELAPLPQGLSPHKLRHTFASLLAALGEPMPYVMAQLGHTDPKFTLRVYAHVMRRDEGERERLRALVEGRDVVEVATSVATHV